MKFRPSEIARDTLGRGRHFVISEIMRHGPLSRSEIAQRIGITEASVSRITREFIDAGIIEETGFIRGPNQPGRKRIGVQIRGEGGYAVAIALNAFSQDIVIGNIASQLVAKRRLHFTDMSTASEVLKICTTELLNLMKQKGLKRQQIVSCATILTGSIDPVGMKVFNAFPIDWQDVDVKEIVKGQLEFPLVLESISNAKNLAARCNGSTRKFDNVVLFNCSLTIGCSVLSEGKLLRGHESKVGMIDSLRVPCKFGELKPINLVAGGIALINEPDSLSSSSSKDLERFSTQLREVIEGNSQEPLVSGACTLYQAGYSLGHAIMNFHSILHPQRILISGPLIASSQYRDGICDAVGTYIGFDFIENRIEFLDMQSYQAALSLAVQHFLLLSGELSETTHNASVAYA
ncbi:MAG: ROK family transcriptional regulator [Gammaproteobacteria bacterium]|nr:ROK family transcriptional regulator [Gammaproteobacteria bacterium]MCY4218800.1 ROK family transcriptional regulator [Gammaproteobacteria bacterium]MCY4274997.1 ROK family transcriptional regulator [Gammaproteobacteria bacterium]